jgi:uncharacterized protein
MLLIDTSGIIAIGQETDTHHAACLATLSAAPRPLLLSPFILAEIDYLLTRRVGQNAAAVVLDDVALGAYELAPMTAADIGRAHAIMRRHHDLNVGLADASIVVLAERYGVGDVLTLDQRHFRALTWHGNPFRILPADA